MPKKLKTLLSIAGSDPMGGAGIQADIRTGMSLGLHVVTAVTAVTAQNSREFKDLGVISHELLRLQLGSIREDVTPDAVKVGMIGSLQNLKVVIDYLRTLPPGTPVVVDPILKSTVGDNRMYEEDNFMDVFQNELVPLATVITPNCEEAVSFQGANAKITTGIQVDKESIKDVLVMGDVILEYIHPKIATHNLHGTGCTYSSLLASFLALGNSLETSFMSASERMAQIIACSCDYSLGASVYGPLNINNYKL